MWGYVSVTLVFFCRTVFVWGYVSVTLVLVLLSDRGQVFVWGYVSVTLVFVLLSDSVCVGIC